MSFLLFNYMFAIFLLKGISHTDMWKRLEKTGCDQKKNYTDVLVQLQYLQISTHQYLSV